MQILTPGQSRSARRKLGLTQTQVIERGGLSGYKLKQFESGYADPEGIPSFLQELRSLYEGLGVRFDDQSPTDKASLADKTIPAGSGEDTVAGAADERSMPAGKPVPVRREAMFICGQFEDFEKDALYSRLEQNRDELKDIVDKPAKSGVFGSFDDNTTKLRDRALELLTEQGVIYGLLFGQCAVDAPSQEVMAEARKVKTVGDVVSLRFSEMFKALDFMVKDSPEGDDQSQASKSGRQARGRKPPREAWI